MRVLYDHCFRATFEPWLGARGGRAHRSGVARALRRVRVSVSSTPRSRRSEDCSPTPPADPTFARIALRLTFAVLEGLATGRMIDVPEDELAAVIDAFNAIAAPYFPQSRRSIMTNTVVLDEKNAQTGSRISSSASRTSRS